MTVLCLAWVDPHNGKVRKKNMDLSANMVNYRYTPTLTGFQGKVMIDRWISVYNTLLPDKSTLYVWHEYHINSYGSYWIYVNIGNQTNIIIIIWISWLFCTRDPTSRYIIYLISPISPPESLVYRHFLHRGWLLMNFFSRISITEAEAKSPALALTVNRWPI